MIQILSYIAQGAIIGFGRYVVDMRGPIEFLRY